MAGALAGRRIVVPETRELDMLVEMLERHAAIAIRCPLVSIRDVDDQRPVVEWLQRFIHDPPDDLVLLTGEGLGRLVGFAQRAGIEQAFIAALWGVRKIARGPKPVRRLQTLGLGAELTVEPATTEGIIATLSHQELAGRRIAVQLYPDAPRALLNFLKEAGAMPDPVLCYEYGSQAEDRRVVEAIDEMAAGKIDLITFTSSPQVRRLQAVAASYGRQAALSEGLRRTAIAAVGPVVARAIEEVGGKVSIAPSENYHLKPMINAILAAVGSAS